MNRLVHRMHNFWFAPVAPARLALLRILVGGYALYYLSNRYELFQRIARGSAEMFHPVGLAMVHAGPLEPALFQLLMMWVLLLNIAFLLGWGYRVSGPGFALALLWLLSYRNSWSMIYHSDNLLVLDVLVLGFSRAGHSLSVDACLRRMVRPGRSPAQEQPDTDCLAPSWHFGWPLRLLCAVMAASYFLAGVAKVAGPAGWSWPLGDVLRSQIAVDALRKTVLDTGGSPLAHLLYPHGWIFTVLGVLTLWLELAAPLIVLDRRLGRAWALAIWLFHWGVFLVMGISFRYQLSGIAFVPFFLQSQTRSTEFESPHPEFKADSDL